MIYSPVVDEAARALRGCGRAAGCRNGKLARLFGSCRRWA
jgi:hypothetical protein